MVVPYKDSRNFRKPPAERFLERIPSGGVLERHVGSGASEGLGGDGVVQADGKVERSLPDRNITAVEDGGDLVGEFFLSDGVGLGADSGRVAEFGEGGNKSGE